MEQKQTRIMLIIMLFITLLMAYFTVKNDREFSQLKQDDMSFYIKTINKKNIDFDKMPITDIGYNNGKCPYLTPTTHYCNFLKIEDYRYVLEEWRTAHLVYGATVQERVQDIYFDRNKNGKVKAYIGKRY